MDMTVTNLLTVAINTPAVGGSGVSPDAVGGTKKYALPYPFSSAGPIAPGATLTLPVHVEDFRYKSVPWLPLEPSREWQMLIQAKVVSVSFAGGGNNVEDNVVTNA